MPPLELRGKAAPVEAWRLVRALPERPRVRGSETPLVGRRRELACWRRALDEAAEGHGILVGLSGEAGIGKSRLALELRSRATAMGFASVWSAAQSYASSFPYHVVESLVSELLDRKPGTPMGDAVRATVGEVPDDTLAELDRRACRHGRRGRCARPLPPGRHDPRGPQVAGRAGPVGRARSASAGTSAAPRARRPALGRCGQPRGPRRAARTGRRAPGRRPRAVSARLDQSLVDAQLVPAGEPRSASRDRCARARRRAGARPGGGRGPDGGAPASVRRQPVLPGGAGSGGRGDRSRRPAAGDRPRAAPGADRRAAAGGERHAPGGRGDRHRVRHADAGGDRAGRRPRRRARGADARRPDRAARR